MRETDTLVYIDHGEPKKYKVSPMDVDEEEGTLEAEIAELAPTQCMEH